MENLMPAEQRAKYLAFRSRYETYLQRDDVRTYSTGSAQSLRNPRNKKLVPDENTVNKMKSSYVAFQVAFPEDTQTRFVEEQCKSLEPVIKAFCEDVQKDIDEAQKELARTKKLPNFSDMTMELFRDSYPELALDPVNRPTFWPHTPQDQPGHKITESELYSHDDK